MMVGVSPAHAWSYKSDEGSLTTSKKHPHYDCHFLEIRCQGQRCPTLGAPRATIYRRSSLIVAS
jgi:hypothetical protein